MCIIVKHCVRECKNLCLKRNCRQLINIITRYFFSLCVCRNFINLIFQHIKVTTTKRYKVSCVYLRNNLAVCVRPFGNKFNKLVLSKCVKFANYTVFVRIFFKRRQNRCIFFRLNRRQRYNKNSTVRHCLVNIGKPCVVICIKLIKGGITHQNAVIFAHKRHNLNRGGKLVKINTVTERMKIKI